MSLEDDIAFLEAVPTLAVLGRPALRILAIGAETRNVPSGAVLYYAGDLADAGYAVQEGSFLLEPDRPGSKCPTQSTCWYTRPQGTLLGRPGNPFGQLRSPTAGG